MIFLVFGLPWSWKSKVSEMIRQKLGDSWEVVKTDLIHKELFPNPNYSLEESVKTFDTLYKRVDKVIQNNKAVIVDGVFTKRGERENIYAIAKKYKIPCFSILITADESVIKDRLWKRTGDISDANFDVYLKLKAFFQFPIEPFIEIKNSDSESLLVASVEKFLNETHS